MTSTPHTTHRCSSLHSPTTSACTRVPYFSLLVSYSLLELLLSAIDNPSSAPSSTPPLWHHVRAILGSGAVYTAVSRTPHSPSSPALSSSRNDRLCQRLTLHSSLSSAEVERHQHHSRLLEEARPSRGHTKTRADQGVSPLPLSSASACLPLPFSPPLTPSLSAAAVTG